MATQDTTTTITTNTIRDIIKETIIEAILAITANIAITTPEATTTDKILTNTNTMDILEVV